MGEVYNMVEVVVTGCRGKMGQVLIKLINEAKNLNLKAGFDINVVDSQQPSIYKSPSLCKEKGDFIIDFSHPNGLDELLEYAKNTNTPIVICTTGFCDQQVEEIVKFSKIIPVFFSFNMSLGINLLCSLAEKATQVLSKDFDIEIIEKHHNQKIDSPSGTAFMIANSINGCVEEKYDYVYGRGLSSGKRLENEIGIHSVRGGTIVGEHEVIFSGHDEVLSISHTAMSKEIFARGAINAGLFLINQKPGLYDMNSMLSGKIL